MRERLVFVVALIPALLGIKKELEALAIIPIYNEEIAVAALLKATCFSFSFDHSPELTRADNTIVSNLKVPDLVIYTQEIAVNAEKTRYLPVLRFSAEGMTATTRLRQTHFYSCVDSHREKRIHRKQRADVVDSAEFDYHSPRGIHTTASARSAGTGGESIVKFINISSLMRRNRRRRRGPLG